MNQSETRIVTECAKVIKLFWENFLVAHAVVKGRSPLYYADVW